MYENFYHLKEKPFQIVPNPHYLYMSPKHQNALTLLEYSLAEGVGFILLTGEIGTGKTTLIRHILNQIETDIEVAGIFNTNFTSDQLLELILTEFEMTPVNGNKVKTLDKLNQFLINKFMENRRVLLIIDEAQNLSGEALEEVRMISNLQTDNQILLQVMLVGQPGLRRILRDPKHAQLAQRIAANYHLSAFSREETGDYIHYRLGKAGGNTDLFTSESIDVIHSTSGGIPRAINLLCDSALVYGYADSIKTIDDTVIHKIISENVEMGFDVNTEDGIVNLKDEVAGGNNTLLEDKFRILEADVRELRTQVEWQINELERRGEDFKETLITKLNDLYLNEKKKSQELLIDLVKLKEKFTALQDANQKEKQ